MRATRMLTGGFLLLALTLLPLGVLADVPGTIETSAGNYDPNGALGTTIPIEAPLGLTTDSAGHVYIADPFRLYRMDPAGLVYLVAGTGLGDYAGDGGPATSASLGYAYGVAADLAGNLYIADLGACRVRKIDAATGIITTVAGNGTCGFGGDGGSATNASLWDPIRVAVDGAGNLYIADHGNNRVRRVDAVTQIITTVAGTGSYGYSGDGGPATGARLGSPTGVAVDGAGNLFVADRGNERIRKIDAATKVITTVAGTGSWGYSGDGGPAANAELNTPYGVAVDVAGNLYIADFNNCRVRKVDATTGIISTIAGNGNWGYSGDGNPATSAEISFPIDVAVEGSGDIFIADVGNQRVRKVAAATQIITTVAGNGFYHYFGDGRPATGAMLSDPVRVTFDGAGNLYIVDRENQRIRKVDAATQIITTVAGNGLCDFGGDGGPATNAKLANPYGVAVDGAGNIFVADCGNQRIRKIDAATKVITTVAGTGSYGYSGDGGPATNAKLANPYGVAVDVAGNLYIADLDNCRIRKVDAATGIITTVAGGGTGGYGDGGPATSATLRYPRGIAVDGTQNLFIADSRNFSIRKVDVATGIITTVAGTGGSHGYSGDGGPATSARLRAVPDIAVDAAGNLFIADEQNQRIRKVDAATKVITTVAGTGSYGYSGDGGPATNARLAYPHGVAVDGAGDLQIADTYNNRIRKVTFSHNQPPIAEAGPDQVVEATSPLGANVTLDGSGSSDPNGDPLTFTWSGPFGTVTGNIIEVTIPLGTHPVVLTIDDGQGGTASDTVVVTVQDTTPPALTWTLAPAANPAGWNNGDVTITFECTDTASAIATPPVSPQVVSTDGAGQSITATCVDAAGNASDATVDGINVDKTPPSVTITSPADLGVYELRQPVVASYSCSDALSGVVSCSGPNPSGGNLGTATVGTFPFRVDATDLAGNAASVTHSYSVNYGFNGFLSPVDNLPVLNIANAGKSVPVKWQLTDATGAYVPDLSTFVSFVCVPIACDSAPTDIITEDVSSSNDPPLKYDPLENQFIYKWDTVKGWSGCYQTQLTLADGTRKLAKFKFK